MDKKTGTGIILVIILVGVITAIAINVWSAKQEVESYQEMQQTISANAENVEEALRIQREESQYAQRMQTKQKFLDTFKVSSRAEVAMASADALGNLGKNGGDSVGGGFSPAGIMAGMAMGGTVIKNAAGLMGDMVGSAMQPSLQQTPPPIPKVLYSVVIDGASAGPYSIEELKVMSESGQLTIQSYVWTQGMQDWERAGNVPELSGLFASGGNLTPPPIPIDAL